MVVFLEGNYLVRPRHVIAPMAWVLLSSNVAAVIDTGRPVQPI